MTDLSRNLGNGNIQPGTSLHFIGIGGIGMSGLAQMYAASGFRVSGSDRGADRQENKRIFEALTAQGIRIYPQDGSYQYHCSWNPREYDIYNGVTQDLWYRGMVVAKAYPDGSRCSYCCGFTFEVFVRAMKLRNLQAGLETDDFNGMTFNDLFNALQLWYIEGKGDSEERAIVSYGLGRAVTNFEDARPGDFLSYSSTPAGGHSVIFLGWLRDEQNKIVGFRYFSSNLSGNGIGFGQAHFSDSTKNGHGVLRHYVNIGHVGAIKDYRPFNRAEIPHRNAYAPTQPERILYLPAPAKG